MALVDGDQLDDVGEVALHPPGSIPGISGRREFITSRNGASVFSRAMGQVAVAF
jgi:hypothetical protein